MMGKLLKKDWRVNRPAVIGAAVLTACPYAYVLLDRALFPPHPELAAHQLMDALEAASMAGLGLTLVMAAVFGGMAFAPERRDGPAEFLAMLPVSRSRIAVSKLLVVLPCTAVPAAIHTTVAVLLLRWESEVRQMPLDYLMKSLAEAAVMGAYVFVLLFGLAWMLSLNLKSPAIAATIAFSLGAILVFVTSTWAHEAVERGELLGWRVSSEFTTDAIAGLSLAVGAVAFLGSTVHYLRRVDP